MNAIRKNLKELFRYPSAVVGLIVILALVGLSIFAMIKIPYNQAIILWRGGEEIWYRNPRQAGPSWLNLIREKQLPISFSMNSADGTARKVVEEQGGELGKTTITYVFDYSYDDFPQDIIIYFKSTFAEKQPFVSLVWLTPDGRRIQLTDLGIEEKFTYRLGQDERLKRLLGGLLPMQGLFKDPNMDTPVPLKGQYQLVVTGYTSEKDSTVDAEFVLQGLLYGLAGTDHMRRDLTVALLWGTPIALAFGLLAAIGTTLTTMIIAAAGAWYGGWVDEVIQRITEINLVLPFLPILIMIGTFYSRSIWIILGVTILLNIFGGGIKSYRAMFMQVKEQPYVEAAKSYGASDARIIFQYLTPRLIPTLIPQLVTLIPTYVFLEASLAVLGLGDPFLPTWGKVINDASSNGALFEGLYYWVMEPAALLLITGLAFALLGFALDRVFNPRLREL